MRNSDIFNESKLYMPGGVNSPVRAYIGLNVDPPVIKKGDGAYVYDEDGKKYIDFVNAWGPMIFGHCDEDIVKAIKETADQSIAFGTPTELELKLAKHICTTIDNVDMIRMVNSGTEATMSAIKLARGCTKRDKIIKFAGCYHGHFDGFLVEAGSGVMTANIPGSPGVPKGSIENTLIAQYNDIESVKQIFEKQGEEIAAIIIEPIAGNMGVVPAQKEFLQGLRDICTKYGSILIFDEVMTGFRVAYKGAQSIYGIKPDLVTFAKIMGGGLPCGAYGGRRDLMEQLAPMGPVYQAGTMSGNPIVMAAGYAALTKLYNNLSYYDQMNSIGEKLQNVVEQIGKEKGLPVVVNRMRTMMTIFFNEGGKVTNYKEAKKCDVNLYGRFFEHMLKGGVIMSPAQFEAMFISVKHTDEHVEKFADLMRKL